jgi:uncharacterized membrane protein
MAKESLKEKHRQKLETAGEGASIRLIGLSDGLFATVLTVLVLDLRIPDALSAGDGNINTFLKWIGPHLFSYLLTFLVTGTYWMGHHRDFDLVIHSDRSLLSYNLLFLLFIGLLPFSTAAVSLVSLKGNVYSFYWTIYALNIILAGIMLTLTWEYAVRHGFVHPNISTEQIRYITLRQLLVPVIFVVSIGAQYLFPQIVLGPISLLLIPVCFGLLDRSFAHAEPKPPSGPRDWSAVLWRAGSILPWILVIGFAVWAMSL